MLRSTTGTRTGRFILVILFAAIGFAPSLAAQVPLTMTKSFSPSTVYPGGTATTTMTVTITNPNVSTVSGIAFSDTYPAGLVPDQVGAYTCSAGSAIFTGTGWALGNVTLAAGASCSVPMRMHATTVGPITNTTSQVTGTGVPPGGPASAILQVIDPTNAPTLSGWMLIAMAVTLAGLCVLQINRLHG